MGFGSAKPPPGPNMDLESAVHRQPAPVCIISGEKRRHDVVLLGPNRSCDDRIPAVGADDRARACRDWPPVRAMPRDADDSPVDVEAFADVPRRPRRPRQTRSLSRTVRNGQYDRSIARARRPGNRDRTEIERVGVDRRTAGRGEAIEKAPSREGSDA